MSEMTRCNYCTLQSIKRQAKEDGKLVTQIGQDVYVHPRKVNIKIMTPKGRKKYFAAWFMELTTSCSC